MNKTDKGTKFGWIVDTKNEDVAFLEFEYDHEHDLWYNSDRDFLVDESIIYPSEQDALEEYLCSVIQQKNYFIRLDRKIVDRLQEVILDA